MMCAMETAVSLPEDLFARLEAFRQRTGMTRNEVVREALERYLQRRAIEEVKAAYDAGYDEEIAAEDEYLASVGKLAQQRLRED